MRIHACVLGLSHPFNGRVGGCARAQGMRGQTAFKTGHCHPDLNADF